MSMDEDLFDAAGNDEDMLDAEDTQNFDMDVDDDQDDEEEDNDNDNEDGEEDGDDNDEGEENEEGDDNDDNEEGEEDGEDGDDNEDDDEDDEDEDEETNDNENEHKEKDPQSKPEKLRQSESPANPEGPTDNRSIRERLVASMKKATDFDIVPIVAIPYAPQCHALAVSEGPKWVLTGGEDGFIRKYDFTASIAGKAPLTVAQKHNLMDSITKAGVIGSYWENEQPLTKAELLAENPKLKASDFNSGTVPYEPKVNPVYSLDVQRDGYWCLSGVLNGGISLYTMIYNEGAIHHYFSHGKKSQPQSIDSGHTDAVSVLRLNHAQDRFLSGLWDKTIREWDLNTGKVTSLFKGSTGQISDIKFRPQGLTDILFKGSVDGDDGSDVDSLFGSSDDENRNDEEKKTKVATNNAVFMSSSIDGTINIWDARVSSSGAVLKLGIPEGIPPWCMTASWSNDGDKLYVGRRNSTVEEINIRMPHLRSATGTTVVPNVSKRLHFPKISGPVSALSVMPNDNFLLCGSLDNIRLYNLSLYHEFAEATASKKRATPFFVIPGHHGGVLSNLHVDDTGRFMISTSGNRGWGHAPYADVVLVYSIDYENSAL